MWKHLRRLTLTHWIFIGLIVGFLIGFFAPGFAPQLKPFRSLFLNGVKCIIAPLIFSTIVTGIASAGSFKQLGVMGVRALIYFEVVTTLALFFGLLAVNVLRPGAGLHVAATDGLQALAKSEISLGGFIEHLLPTNVADAVVRGDVLQIVIVSTIFAFAVLAVGAKAKPVLNLCESLAEVMFRFTGYIMLLAPLGVGAALATSMAEHGWQVIFPMLKLVGTLYLALIVFVLAVFLPILKIFKIPVRAFFGHVKEAVILAFATTSSESAYPLALDSMEKFGVPRRISSFVLPMGYSFNLDGSTLYLAVASVFVAQASGIELSIGTQLAMMASLMLTTKGVAAVPRASIVVLSGTLSAFGIPLEGIALIMAVDEFMDMARTGVNLLGNCLATAVIARCEDISLG
jgi:proton glutamate symport protein